jgi:hypothetical protein
LPRPCHAPLAHFRASISGSSGGSSPKTKVGALFLG